MADSNYKLHGHLGVNLFGCIMVKTSVYNEAFVSMLSVIIISVATCYYSTLCIVTTMVNAHQLCTVRVYMY